ncbi:serine hydrolase [Caulobacter segnis]|uniref:serine hydrolase domain-containing protein n=1 Tax=Caulobacter segnis TaxID=88688 RepID=UPI0024104D76|nr:serine hydrolase [Caulobacter segnis]MDG2522564.1 serine hydrolase [Caulobacter segnis]
MGGGAWAPGRRGLLAGALSAAGLALGGCATSAPSVNAAGRGPGPGPWRSGDPMAHGLSREALDRAADTLGAAGERQGLAVVRGGALVYERYFANDWHRADPHWRNVSFSSGKSWGATMVGRAVTQGRLKLDDLASDYHCAQMSGLQPQTTIRHLLTMTSGGTLNVKPSSKPPKRLDQPAVPGPGVDYEWQTRGEPGSPDGYGRSIAPGTTFYYDGAAADHLADIVAAAVGETSHAYMMREVVAALGCEDFAYQSEGIDPRGNIRIGGSITLSCRDMARLGQLYLDKGRWGGRQLIDPAFIAAAWTPSPLNASYGFLWWLNTTGRVPLAPRSMAFAAGARGQFCFVLPEQDLVVATMGFGRQQLTAEAAWAALAPALL